jgi:Chitin binding Peritrophin-A domain
LDKCGVFSLIFSQIGDSTDETCTKWMFCNEGARLPNIFTCGAGLRFNRLTGVCDRSENVICPTPTPPRIPLEKCQDELGADLPDGDVYFGPPCGQFITCIGGIPQPEIFTCPSSLHFDPISRTCVLPAQVAPPCVSSAPPKTFSYIPRAPNSPMKSFRQRILGKLHL